MIVAHITRIASNNMLAFEGVLSGIDDHVLYKKKEIKEGHFLHVFRSARKAAIEEAAFLARREEKNDYDPATYAKKKDLLVSSFSNPIRIWIPEQLISAMTIAGCWNWSSIITRTMNVG